MRRRRREQIERRIAVRPHLVGERAERVPIERLWREGAAPIARQRRVQLRGSAAEHGRA